MLKFGSDFKISFIKIFLIKNPKKKNWCLLEDKYIFTTETYKFNAARLIVIE